LPNKQSSSETDILKSSRIDNLEAMEFKGGQNSPDHGDSLSGGRTVDTAPASGRLCCSDHVTCSQSDQCDHDQQLAIKIRPDLLETA